MLALDVRTGQIKVGDRVLTEAVGLGKPYSCTVIGTNELTGAYMPGYTNQYLIRCDKEAWSSVPATGGSFVEYQCSVLDAKFDSRFNNFGKNCNTYQNRKATGYCFKTTFGDWNCSMNDVFKADDDKRFNVPPPYVVTTR